MSKDDSSFKTFAHSLDLAIEHCGDVGDFFVAQKAQLTELIGLEIQFRKLLQKQHDGEAVYAEFINYILEERKILSARPYFRERSKKFTAEISPLFKTRNAKGMYPYAVNYLFCQFALKARPWPKYHKLRALFRKLTKLRNLIVVLNMPLAISRARIFFSRTPKSHISYLDLIQISAEGLMNGLDKYTPDETGIVAKTFRSTVLCRISGNQIESFSAPMIHFSPLDRRKLYRANKMVGKFADAIDYAKLAEKVNTGDGKMDPMRPAEYASGDEIAGLLTSQSFLSLDQKPAENENMENHPSRGQWDVAPDDVRPDVQAEQSEVLKTLSYAISKLTVFERKLLRLKGVVV